MENSTNHTEEIKDIWDWKVIEEAFQEGGEIVRFRRMIMRYQCAMLEVKTKLDVLNAELSLQTSRNPFETIKCRIKSPRSILEKLERNHLTPTVENAENNLNDIAGVRVICSFPDDIYMLADCLLAQDDITLIAKKDYIKNPKPNGYRSLHLILEVPIFLTDEKKPMRVEVQFRTIAMDFWASLEHKIYYKFEGNAPRSLEVELKVCAEIVDMLDGKMFSLNESIMKISGEQSGAENRPDERRPDKWTGLLTGGAQEEAPGGLEGSAGDCIAERDTAQEALKEQDPDGV